MTENHQTVLILMAICYSYLSEPNLMRESLQRAEEVYNWRHRVPYGSSRFEMDARDMLEFFTAMASPKTWLNMNSTYEIYTKDELEKIKDNLEQI
jgi:hypothetical protein